MAKDNYFGMILPKKTVNPVGLSVTPTYNAAAPQFILTLPAFRDHMNDLMTDRQSSDAPTLIRSLLKTDPDMSAALHAYLTVANQKPLLVCRTPDGVIDRAGQKMLNQMVLTLTQQYDYSKGFQHKRSLRTLAADSRYTILANGAVANELIIDKLGIVTDFRDIDPGTLRWTETAPGVYMPWQYISGKTGTGPSGTNPLNSIQFAVTFLRRDPKSMYASSIFISAINTIAARQQVVNDLYRIMQITGYPRMDIEVMEEVILKNAPADIKADKIKQVQYVNETMTAIRSYVSTLRPDQAFVHLDSVSTTMLNEKTPGLSIDIGPVTDFLNAQNQAALKTMATILGRGESGVNTASVEARVFAMMAAELNYVVAEQWSKLFTLGVRAATGSDSYVEVTFPDPELRSELELEPNKTMRRARLAEDLSLGIIDDDEYHMQMYGRLRPDSAKILSGTGFTVSLKPDASNVSPNQDSLGRSLTPGNNNAPKDNAVKKSTAKA